MQYFSCCVHWAEKGRGGVCFSCVQVCGFLVTNEILTMLFYLFFKSVHLNLAVAYTVIRGNLWFVGIAVFNCHTPLVAEDFPHISLGYSVKIWVTVVCYSRAFVYISGIPSISSAFVNDTLHSSAPVFLLIVFSVWPTKYNNLYPNASFVKQDIDWVQTEKHVFEQASNHPFLVGLHSCFQTESR